MPTIVAKREGILDRERYDSPRSEVLASGHARLDDAPTREGVPAAV